MPGRIAIAVCTMAAGLLWTTVASAGPTYRLTNLGASIEGLGIMRANGLSSNGYVTGDLLFESGGGAYLHDGTSVRMLPTLPGDTSSVGSAVNSRGMVAGYSSGRTDTTAFLYDGIGGTRSLGTLGGRSSFAFGLNDHGSVVGYSETAVGRRHAFLSDGATMRDLGTLGGGNSFAYGINNWGWIAGRAETVAGDDHAFLFDGSRMRDLGTLGGSSSWAWAVSTSGLVTGASAIAGNDHTRAFVFDGTTMIDIGSPGLVSAGMGINGSGQVVGWHRPTDPRLGDQSAFLYSGGKSYDLQGLLNATGAGWRLDQATGINDAGQIIALGYRAGHYQAVLLTPVPEPSALALASAGLLTCAMFIRRRQRLFAASGRSPAEALPS